MTGAHIKLDYTQGDIASALGELLARQTGAAPAFKDMGEEWLGNTKQRFREEVTPDGTPWPDNAPATKARKRNPKILQDLGEQGGLLGSLAYNAKNDGLALGTPKPYGALQHFGGQAGRNRSVTVPAREYLGVSDRDERAFGEILADHLLG